MASKPEETAVDRAARRNLLAENSLYRSLLEFYVENYFTKKDDGADDVETYTRVMVADFVTQRINALKKNQLTVEKCKSSMEELMILFKTLNINDEENKNVIIEMFNELQCLSKTLDDVIPYGKKIYEDLIMLMENIILEVEKSSPYFIVVKSDFCRKALRFKIDKTTAMKKLMLIFCKELNMNVHILRFTYKDQVITGSENAVTLNMLPCDEIKVTLV